MLSEYYRRRLLLLVGSAICFEAFWLAGKIFHIPPAPGFDGSLMMQDHPAAALAVTAVLIAATMAAGTVIAGSVRPEAGLFTAAVGLIALSIRGGSIRTILQSQPANPDPAIFLRLIGEIFFLYAILALCWIGVRKFGGKVDAADSSRPKPSRDPWQEHLIALVTQVVVTGLVILLVAQGIKKSQALGAVALGAFAGSCAGYLSSPSRNSAWYWPTPLIVAVVGYLMVLRSPQGLEIGYPQGFLAGLARATPLDYAGGGTVGSIMGYWLIRRWVTEEVSIPSGNGLGTVKKEH